MNAKFVTVAQNVQGQKRMRVIIAGSRGITDFGLVEQAIRQANFVITEVVSGHAGGVDTLGERWAGLNGVTLKIFPAYWKEYGKRAGYLRNEEMAAYADAVICVWDGVSRGTKHMIDIANKRNLPLFVLKVTGVSSKA